MPAILRVFCRPDPRVLERIRPWCPALVLTGLGVDVELNGVVPEEVLTACRAAGLAVRGSVVITVPDPG